MNKQIEDQLFGTLVYNEDLEEYCVKIEISPEQYIDLSIAVWKISADEAIKRAHEVFPRLQDREAALRRTTAVEKLTLYNEEWSPGEKIDVDEFARRIVLSSVAIYPEGNVDLWYADGDLFAGHWLGVRADSDLQFEDVELAGQNDSATMDLHHAVTLTYFFPDPSSNLTLRFAN
jgi:hypothetical protein